MSDTPETNAALFDAFDGQGGEVVFADFARKLERERNRYKSDVEVITKERDEARLQYGSTHALAEVLVKSRNEFLEALRDIANLDVTEGARAVWRAKEALK